jgi:ABC-type phosphonate transport system ATPase subunit
MVPPFESKEQPTDEFSHEVGIVPIRIKALLEESDSIEQKRRALTVARKLIEEQERDDYEAQEEAAADLIRLDRYERRAWSRQKRAIRSYEPKNDVRHESSRNFRSVEPRIESDL